MHSPRIVRAYFNALQAIAPGAAVRQATRIFCTPRPRRRRAAVPIAGHAPIAFTVTAGRDRMRCWRYGSGPVVLLVHGWGGSAHDWPALVEALVAAGYTAVTVDLPAHGSSSGRRTTLPGIARALQALAHELAFTRGDRFEPLEAVIAHSFGAAATALAARDGLLANSFVLLAPVARPMAFLEPVAAALGLRAARVPEMREQIRVLAGGDLERIEVLPAIRAVRTRGLVVHDRDDVAVPWTEGRDIADAWPAADHLWTEGLGHRGVLRDPAVVRAAVEFISRTATVEEAPPWATLRAAAG